jgi:hypothetical protein
MTVISFPSSGLAILVSALLFVTVPANAAQNAAPQVAAAPVANPPIAQSQPPAITPRLDAGTAAETPVAERMSAASTSERERLLVERLELLERRFNEREQTLVEQNEQLEQGWPNWSDGWEGSLRRMRRPTSQQRPTLRLRRPSRPGLRRRWKHEA